MRKTLVAAAIVMAVAPAFAAEDHAAHIKGPFATPMDVTKACLECHPKASAEVMKTTHWTWSREEEISGKGKVAYGKKNIINNYCISLAGNYPRCTSCHAGYGWKDASFDFSDSSRVDCLVCHDQSGTYKKIPTGAGMPDEKVDLVVVAKSVGKPGLKNCGVCHFYGGGADSVKHGDLDSTMGAPSKEIDAHMAKDGAGLLCVSCHTSKEHYIKGAAVVDSPDGVNRFECDSCHSKPPHKDEALNKHTSTVACQTCHIPQYARGQATKSDWDWSTAGKDTPESKDAYGKPVYDKKKGNFVWVKDAKPEYLWFDGTASVYVAGDKINAEGVTLLDSPNGKKGDGKSKIYPFKPFTGKQPYDVKNGYFITPKLFGPDGYWATFDWTKASELGMKQSGLAFGGEVGFAKTKMYWKLNHQVSPKAAALKCADCHGGDRLDWKALGYAGDPKK